MPGLLVYGIGIPVASFLLLFRQRASLHKPELQERYGFLYLPYRQKFWFWESVVVLRKFCLALCSVLLSTSGVGFQISLTVIMLVISLVLHDHALPFRERFINSLETASITCSITTLAGGAALIDSSSSLVARQFVSIVIVVINVALTCTIVAILSRMAWRRSAGKVARAAAARLGILSKSSKRATSQQADRPAAAALEMVDAKEGQRALSLSQPSVVNPLMKSKAAINLPPTV